MIAAPISVVPIECHICSTTFEIDQGLICIKCSQFTCRYCTKTTSIKSFILKKDKICKDCYNRENNHIIDK